MIHFIGYRMTFTNLHYKEENLIRPIKLYLNCQNVCRMDINVYIMLRYFVKTCVLFDYLLYVKKSLKILNG